MKNAISKPKTFYARDFVAVAMVLAVLIASIVMLTAKRAAPSKFTLTETDLFLFFGQKPHLRGRLRQRQNVVEIKDGKVSVIDADCNNRACVKSNAISKKGEQIVCLPHKLIVVIKGGSEGELDART